MAGLRILAGMLCFCAAAGAWASAQGREGQSPSVQPVALRDISGFWGLEFDGRKIPPASLVPSVTRRMLDEFAKRDAHNVRWCNLVGVPAAMDMGRPIDIRQGLTTIIMVPEASPVAPRYVYLNRATHINEGVFDPSTNGDSIGRWEGDTLVVDTIGFHETHGLMAIPGGAYRTPSAFDGKPMYLATLAGGDTRIVRPDGNVETEIGAMQISDAVRRVAGPDALADLRVITQYDWFYRDRRRERPLPVVLVALSDEVSTRYYIDPRNGRTVGAYNSHDRLNRWAYHALHSLDVPWLYNHRPLWDIVVIVFMLGGGALSITSVVLGWQVLRRRFGT